jgi:alpha-beta hydrolase superfamily lysophospholipase
MTKRIYQGAIQPSGFPPIPKDWISDWETFPSSDEKLKLFSVLHHHKDWVGRRVVAVVHGFGEHGGRYLHFPHYLQSVSDAVYCLDLRGHGRSEGIRGHTDRFDLFSDDLAHGIRRLNHYLLKKFNAQKI